MGQFFGVPGPSKDDFDTLNSNIANIVKHKNVTLSSDTIGTSFSQTSRNIGSASTLFGVNASKIVGIVSLNANLSPAANITFGFSSGNCWAAATQTTTLSGNIEVNIAYFDE